MKKWKGFPYLMGALAVVLVGAIYLYLVCPAINIQNPALWVMVAVLTLIFLVVSQICRSHDEPMISIVSDKGKQKHIRFNGNYKLYLIPVVVMVLLGIGSLIGSEVFNAKGEVIEITVNGAVSTGFHQFATDAEGVTTLTSINAATDVKRNQLFDTVFGNKLVTNGIDHYDLTGAIIIDVRDEELIEGSEVYKIETIADMQSLKSIDAAEIYMDIYVDSADETVSIIFITKVVALYTPDDGEALTFVRAATVDGETVVWATKTDATAEEVKVEVDMTLTAAQALTGTITYDAANNKF